LEETPVTIEFTVSTTINAPPQEVYAVWMSSEGHTRMTGGQATITPQAGAAFDAWDGYIQGKNLELDPGRRIVQSWRTVEFAENEPDSQIEITLEPVDGGTKLTLHHTGLPPHGGQYEQGWVESYFDPMKEYFG
jgi:uncharacterized protein YndB with AHSA1/START domain